MRESKLASEPALAKSRWAAVDRLRQLWQTLKSEDVPRLGLYFLLILFLSGLGVFWLEHGVNHAFRTAEDGFWWALVTLTTIGYGDKYPVTTPGRLLAGVVILFGIGMVGIITGKIASALVERRIKEGRGLSQRRGLSGQFVIMGWKPDMHLLIEGILAAHPDLPPERLVLINTAGQALNEELRNRFKGLVYLHGDIIDPLVLQRAEIARAAKVFVLADVSGSRSDQEADARTVMAVMNIENLAPEVYTYAEVLDVQYADYLRLAHCDEIILSREYGRFMLVSASVSEGISQALLGLMDVTGTGGLASEEVPAAFVGRRFGDLAQHLKSVQGKLLVGLIENTGQPLAFKREALREAQKTTNVATLVENLRRVKEMLANKPVLNPGDEYLIGPHARAIVLARSDAGQEGERS